MDDLLCSAGVPARFVDFDELERCGQLPRYGSDRSFKHALTGQPNLNMSREFQSFRRDSTAFVFVSQRWLTPKLGPAGHPDDACHHQYALIVSACKKLRGPLAPVPEHFNIAVWIDFCCIDQDGAPTSEMEQLGALMQLCDLVLTPIYDEKHAEWESPAVWTNYFTQYKAAAWAEYWQRGWCRAEVFLAAVKPVRGGKERAKLFHGVIRKSMEKGRRPHVLYGSKEEWLRKPPLVLPPMLNSYFATFRPSEGLLTKERFDRPMIARLEADGRREAAAADVAAGYAGERNERGEKHGHGAFRWETGDVYEGAWENNNMKGFGVFESASGARYEGEWQNSVRHGHAREVLADGGIYEGSYRKNLRCGHGCFQDASGTFYEGQWQDLKHGWGKFYFTDGGSYEGEWSQDAMHGEGRYVAADGSVHEGTFSGSRLLETHKVKLREIPNERGPPKGKWTPR